MMRTYSRGVCSVRGTSYSPMWRCKKWCRRQLLVLLVIVGGAFWSAAPAQASSFVSSLVPHLGLMWKIFYCLIGLFAIVAIWEIAVMILLRNARQMIVDDNGEVIAEQEPDEWNTGLISDATEIDPFQALINQASSDETPVGGTPAPSKDSPVTLSKRDSAPGSPVPVFDGAATLPIGTASSIGMGNGGFEAGSGNPFRKAVGGNDAEVRGAGAASAMRPVGRSGGIKPDDIGGAANAAAIDGGKTLVASAVAGGRTGASPAVPGGSSSAVASFAGSGRAVSGSTNPFGSKNAGEAGTAPRNVGVRAVGSAGTVSSEDPWKKLLGQTSVVSPKKETPEAGGVIGAPRGLSVGSKTTVGNSIKLGSNPDSGRKPVAGGAGAPVAASGSADPWKALLGVAGKESVGDEQPFGGGRGASGVSRKPVVEFTKEELEGTSDMRGQI